MSDNSASGGFKGKKLFGVNIGFGKKKKSISVLDFSQSTSNTNNNNILSSDSDLPHPSIANTAPIASDPQPANDPMKLRSLTVGKADAPRFQYSINSDSLPIGSGDQQDNPLPSKFYNTVDNNINASSNSLSSMQAPDDDNSSDKADGEDDLFVSDYTKEWMKLEENREGQTRNHRKHVSASDMLKMHGIDITSRPLSDRDKTIAVVPGKNWKQAAIEQASERAASSMDPRKLADEQMSCIRVFRRDGTFSTVSCPLSITCNDLCILLAKKFFFQTDVGSKYKLWLVRHGDEILMQTTDKPLKIQQQLLYEMGYDHQFDRFQEILREDNSYLYRWIYSDVSLFDLTYQGIAGKIHQDSFLSKISLPTLYEQRIFELIKLSENENPVDSNDSSLSVVDLSRMNIDSIPLPFIRRANQIKSLKLAGNLMLEISLDFAHLCASLSYLDLSYIQLRKVPFAVSKLRCLSHLNLSNNFITTLKDSGMEDLKVLKILNLSNNRILSKKSLPVEILSSWISLISLDLSCNWLRGDFPLSLMFIGTGVKTLPPNLDEHNFTTDNQVEELNVSYNLIRSVHPQIVQAFSKLRILRMAGNAIVKLPQEIITMLSKLEIFDIRGNRIRGIISISSTSTIETAPASADTKLTPSPEKADVPYRLSDPNVSAHASLTGLDVGNHSMKKLFLDNNHISDIKLDHKLDILSSIISHKNPSLLQITISKQLSSLTTLVISSSRLAFLPDDIFTNTPHLRVLVLNYNQLSMLPVSIGSLKDLIRLELVHNSITKFPSTIKDLKSLEILDARGNNLKDLPVELWALSIRFLNLSSNVIESWPDVPFSHNSGENSNRVSISNSIRNQTLPSTGAYSTASDTSSADIDSAPASPTKRGSRTASMHMSSAVSGISPLSLSLQWLSIADNRLESAFFENAIFNMLSLKYLNVSHNEIFGVPNGTLRNCSATLEELYLSGNHLTQLPEEIQLIKRLRILYLNNNRLGSLPPEIGKMSNLRILDVGRNQLRYNVANWPYDWNWNWNTELRYLNLSGNPRLEIRSNNANNTPSSSKKSNPAIPIFDKGDIARFDLLKKIRYLGLMEVSLSVPIPDETIDRRVRVNALGGASAHWKKQMGIDNTTQDTPTLITKNSDVNAPTSTTGSTISNALMVGNSVDVSLNVTPPVSYGVAEYLGVNEKSSAWDLVILGGRFLQTAKDELKAFEKVSEVSAGGTIPRVSKYAQKKKVGECVFGLFDGRSTGENWCTKFLNDTFTTKFSNELKKVAKERQSKKQNSTGSNELFPSSDNDSVIIEHALRRTFLLMNKHFGDLSWKSEYKFKDARDSQDDSKKEKTQTNEPEKRRKHSISFETPLQGRLKKSRKNLATLAESTEFSATSNSLESKNKRGSSEAVAYDGYWEPSDDCSDSDDDSAEESYIKLQNSGYSGLIAYIVNSQLYISNVGDVMAVVSRNGVAIPVSTKHTLYSVQTTVSKPQVSAEQTSDEKDEKKRQTKIEPLADLKKPTRKDSEKTTAVSKLETSNVSTAKRELHRVRETGGCISADGLLCEKTIFTRSFGYFGLLPHINARPDIMKIDLMEQDEFLIIGTGSFWNKMHYQTAVDVARSKADDALEASFVLRDFASAYSTGGTYIADEEAESSEDKFHLKSLVPNDLDNKRIRIRDALTVMVINLRDFIGINKRKPFNKIKRRRDETADSGIARIAAEVEPPTGFVTLVFTDVRNSTALWEKMPIAMRVAIREHNQIMRRNLRKFSGYEVKTEGDAFMVAFKTVVDALGWCAAVQLQLLEADWPQEILESVDGQDLYGPASLIEDSPLELNESSLLYRGLSIRMGLHCGNPVSELDPVTRRMDYFGPMVNKTSRICGAAEGGQILMSLDVEKAFKKAKLATIRDSQLIVDNVTTISYVNETKSAPGNEKTPAIFNLDPVFIGVGEKKLKGFENPEPLISLLPQTLVGRYRIPPPSLPGTENVALDNSKVETLANTPFHEKTRREDSLSEEQVSLSSERRQSITSLASDSSNSKQQSKINSLTLTKVNEDETEKPSEDLSNRISIISIGTNEKDTNPYDMETLELLCVRLEAVAFDLIKNFSLELLENDYSRDDIFHLIPRLRRNSMFTEKNDTSYVDTNGFSEVRYANLTKRLECAASAISTMYSSSIIEDIRTKSKEEKLDFGRMLAMLLSNISDEFNPNNNNINTIHDNSNSF